MKTSYAIALLLCAASAQSITFESDLFDTGSEGTPITIDEYYANKYTGYKWFMIVTAFMYAVYAMPLVGAYMSSLGTIGVVFTAVSWGIGALQFAGYLPVGILGIFTDVDDVHANKRWRGWLIASNIYGWILAASQEVWWVVVVLFVLIFHTFGAGVTAPTIWIPVVGISLELIMQVMFSIGYGKSKKLMECWIHQTTEYCYY